MREHYGFNDDDLREEWFHTVQDGCENFDEETSTACLVCDHCVLHTDHIVAMALDGDRDLDGTLNAVAGKAWTKLKEELQNA